LDRATSLNLTKLCIIWILERLLEKNKVDNEDSDCIERRKAQYDSDSIMIEFQKAIVESTTFNVE